MLFYPKPRDGTPLVFIPQTPQVVLGPLYLDGGGPREARLGGGGVPGTSFPVAPHGGPQRFKARDTVSGGPQEGRFLAGSLGHGHSTPGAHGTTVLKCCFSTPKLVMLVNAIFTGDSNDLFL